MASKEKIKAVAYLRTSSMPALERTKTAKNGKGLPLRDTPSVLASRSSTASMIRQ
jgi:hypothetical protein